ncbi:cupin domain-containing protein [Lentzea sp. NPDC042327]|uniref:cupin domain-containing protein n=1 Tax=Lentzea sp. NPDC042327 TaxID=3154801 RepID=UPI0033E4AB09
MSDTPQDKVTVISPDALAQMKPFPLHGDEGLQNRMLWRSPTGDTVVGLIQMAPGARDAGHVHPTAAQHTWVVDGTVSIGGVEATAGSYAVVPPGVDHETVAGDQPVTMFYVFQPFAPKHDHGH